MELKIRDYMLLNTLLSEYKDNDVELEKQILKRFNMMGKPLVEGKKFIAELIKELNKDDYKHQLTFNFKGREFGFIPNLNDMTVGEYVDIETYQSSPESIHKLMSILYRPIIKKRGKYYEIEKYSGTEKWSNEFLDLPAHYYKSSMVFFYNLSKELLQGSIISIQKTKNRMKKMKISKD